MAGRYIKATIQMNKLFGADGVGWQGSKGVWCMVNPKDVSAGQGKEDSGETCNRKRIRKVYSTAKACQNRPKQGVNQPSCFGLKPKQTKTVRTK